MKSERIKAAAERAAEKAGFIEQAIPIMDFVFKIIERCQKMRQERELNDALPGALANPTQKRRRKTERKLRRKIGCGKREAGIVIESLINDAQDTSAVCAAIEELDA